MTQIRVLGKREVGRLQELAELHVKAFPSFFLTQLGVAFLETLYEGYLTDEVSGIVIAEEKGELVGFVAYSMDYPNFYRGLIKKKLLRFATCALWAVIHHPSFVKRLLGAFGKSRAVEKSDQYVELASICVHPERGGNGIGSALIGYLKDMVDFHKYAFINLETDRDGNERANRFYQKNDFRLAFQYITSEGRRMNEYRYAPGETT